MLRLLSDDADAARKATSRKIILGLMLGLAAFATIGVITVRSINRSIDRREFEH